MQNIRVLMAVVLLLIQGCTYLDDVNEESSKRILRKSNRFGCTDSEAENYDSQATEDDGSCEYEEPDQSRAFGLY